MKSVLNTLKTAYNYSIEMSERKRTLAFLQTQSEYSLLDKGFAPHLVAAGLRAYPWRVVKEATAPISIPVTGVAKVDAPNETIKYATAA